MRGPHNIWRLLRSAATLERTGAMGVVLDAFNAPLALRWTSRTLALPFLWLGYRGDPSRPPLTRALTALGPAYIKFGQLMSTRPDVIGRELASELQVLQDKLPPFPVDEAKAVVVSELGHPIEELFSEFSEAIAGASIAQVHRARLVEDGREVAVKVLRPGIQRAFRRDIDAFYFGADTIELLSPASRRLRPHDVIEHFEGVVAGELDLRMETSAAAEFAASTEGDTGFQVPRVEWSLSARQVMTLGWAEGIPAHDLVAIDAAGHDRRALAQRVLKLFLSHALRDGYFHADMHQGNLKVAENGDIIAVDFGIMGRIDEYTRRVYAEILFGFIRKNYRRVAEVHFEAGYVPAGQDIDDFARALRSVGEPIFGLDASKLSMARLLSHLFEVTERFGMETRKELILLQRTMVVVEGVARSLDSHVNIWEVARPIVEDYIKKNVGPRAVLRDFSRSMQVISRVGPKLPELVEAALIRGATEPRERSQWRLGRSALLMALGAGLALAGVLLGQGL